MSMFGGISSELSQSGQQQVSLGTVDPTARFRAACDDLHAAEEAYASAEDRLIKARRAYKIANDEYRAFYHPKQKG